MTMPFNPSPNGAPAPGQASFPMPPGQATFQAPTPALPATVVREQGWSGYPASAIPPMPQPAQPQTAAQPQSPFQQPQQPAPQFQQAPQQPAQYQPGMQVPTQYVQPQVQPGQQFQPAQPQAQVPQGIDPNTILRGPSFPAELQGVTLGQAIQMYGGMRELILGLQQRQAQVAAQAPAPQQQASQTQQPGQQQPPPFDWRNPGPSLAAIIGPMLDERLGQALAPITQQAALQGAAQARNAVAQEIGVQRFAQLEPHVMRYLQGAGPQDLANPELWRVAVRTAAGELALSGQQPMQGRAPAAGQYGGAVPFQPGMQNPAPPLQSFFTESPQTGGQAVQGVTLTPQQMWFADQMGVSYADYAAYSQGVPSVLPGQGGRR